MMDAMMMFAMYAAKAAPNEAKIAEPEFKPFQFPGKAVHVAAVVPANTARAVRTLEELGIPRALAMELEFALRGAGHTRGDRVTGFTFRAVDGTRYGLRIAAPAVRDTNKRAA